MFVLKDSDLQIFYRKNVNKMWPEGSLWVCVPIKGDCSEPRYIDCGPSGSVWVVLWSGVILVRKKVSVEMPQGKSITKFKNRKKNCYLVYL